MSNDKNTPPGAPSDDTTSALFVSARKKQLEQQEADRRAKEKEEQRLAAEAEVQRLEREVEERRRKAEEEKKLAEEEAIRIAEEAQAKKAMAETNPNMVLGTLQIPAKPAQKAQRPPNAVTSPAVGEFITRLLNNKKMLAIIGGAAAAVIVLVIVLVTSLGGGGGVRVDPNMELSSHFAKFGISFSYPEKWDAYAEENPLIVMILSDYEHNSISDTVVLMDVTDEYLNYVYNYTEPILAGEWILENSIHGFIGDGAFDEYVLDGLGETGDGWLTGGTDLHGVTAGGDKLYLYLEFVQSNDQLLLAMIGIPERRNGFDDALTLCIRIAATAELESYPAYNDQAYAEPQENSAPAYDEPQAYHDLNTGIFFEYPDGWYVAQASGASTFYAPVVIKQSADALDRMLVYNYTPEFNDFVQSGYSGMEVLLGDFADWFLDDVGYDHDDIYNVVFSDIMTIGTHEVILLQFENDEAYFFFYLIKILSEPQQVAAIVLETKSIGVRDDFDIVINTLELR